jgi:hypothetical protein
LTERIASVMGGKARRALLALDGFAALSAVGGGGALATGLEGDRFPPELLQGTPFTSYRIPGAILALVVGGSATAAAAATLRDRKAGPHISAVAGAVMIGWIGGELLIGRAPAARSWIEVLYAGVGVLMATIGLAQAHRERTAARSRCGRAAP